MKFINSNYNITSVVNIVTTEWTESEATTKDTFIEEVESYTTFKIAIFLVRYWFPVLVPIGLVGNILSFLVIIKPNNRKISTCIYMAAISINDNIMMLVCLHYYLLSAVQIHSWNSFECKFLAFEALFALQNGTFLVVTMTIDKYIAIKWPHKAAIYSTARRAKIIVGSVYISVFIYNIPHFFLSIVIGRQCLNFGIRGVITSIYSWFSFVLNAVIPFTMLIYMNYVIVRAVRNSRVFFKGSDTGKGRDQGMETRKKTMKSTEKQLAIMLLLVTILFLILLCPTYFRFIYLVFGKRDTPFKYAQSMLFSEITGNLYASDSGINFFLYCISGKKFRNDLKEILCYCCLRKDQLQSSSKGVRTIHTERELNPI